MAQTVTLEGLRSQIITQLYGRRVGLAYGNSSDAAAGGQAAFMVGPAAHRWPITAISTASTAADQIPAYGITLFNTTGASTSATTYHSILNPIPGVTALVVNQSTLTMTLQLNGSSGTTAVVAYCIGAGVGAGSTGLTTATAIKLPVPGSAVRLTGLTTGIWVAESRFGDTVTTWGTSVT